MTARETNMRREIDADDIQAIVRTAFGSFKSARYMLLRVVEPSAARQWLRGLTPTSLTQLPLKDDAEISQIALTAAGLREIGVNDAIVEQFAPEFVEGVAKNENRSRRLGDTGANSPTNWYWGVGEKEPHILLMLFSSAAQIEAFAARMQKQALAAGLSMIAAERFVVKIN